jgi:membrane protein implicated in regulation of membrane protease activity
MSFVIGTILSFMFLDPPWRYLAIVPLALWEGFEIYLWSKWRRVRSITGQEAFVGSTGRAVTDCRPEGQVRVKGALWRAQCPDGVDAGDGIVVEAIDGMLLTVRPRDLATRRTIREGRTAEDPRPLPRLPTTRC